MLSRATRTSSGINIMSKIHKEISDSYSYEQVAAVLCLILISFFSPLIAFYASVFLLLAFSLSLSRKAVSWVGYVCAYSGSVIVSSRATFGASDDFSSYYDAYLLIFNGDFSAGSNLFGAELGLPIYYYLLSCFGKSNQIFVLFAVALLSSSLFVLWLDKFGSLIFPPARYGTLMAISLLFFNFASATQVTRQMISLPFVLFAISVTGWRTIVWLIFAGLFHQSTLLIFLLFKMVERLGWYMAAMAIIFGIFFSLFFNQIIEIALSFDSNLISLFSKFAFYQDNYDQNMQVNLSGLKFVAIGCIAALLSAKFMPRGWGELILSVGVIYILLLPFPLVPFRTFLIFVAVISGYIASFLAFRVGWSVVSWGAAIYAIYLALKQLSMSHSDTFYLWDKFDWFGYFPMYYFLK